MLSTQSSFLEPFVPALITILFCFNAPRPTHFSRNSLLITPTLGWLSTASESCAVAGGRPVRLVLQLLGDCPDLLRAELGGGGGGRGGEARAEGAAL